MNIKLFSPTVLSLSILSAYAINGIAHAQTQSNDTVETLSPIVAVASYAPKTISEIPATVWYIDSEDITNAVQTGQSLSSILSSQVPSLDFGSQGRTNNGQNLRGRAMLVMIDGVSLSSARKISRQLDSIDPSNIERIEVLSGASSVYGGDATGGVINIITKKGEAGPLHGDVSVTGTSGFQSSQDRDLGTSLSLSGGKENAFGRFSIAYRQNKAAYDGNGDLIVPDITQGSLQFNKSLDLMASGTFKFSDTQTLNLLAQYYDSQQDSPYGFDFGKNLIGLRTKEVKLSDDFSSDRQARTQRYMLNADYHHADFLGHDLYAQLSYRKEKLGFIPFPAGAYISTSQQDTDVLSLKTVLHKSWDKLSVSYGVDGYIDKFTSSQTIFDPRISAATGGLVNRTLGETGRYPGTKVQSISGFAQFDYKLTQNLLLSAGYRYQHLKNSIDDFVASSQQASVLLGKAKSAGIIPGGSNSYNVNLFNVGLNYNFDARNKVWVNFSQGFEVPDPAKYYGQGLYASKPNSSGHLALLKGVDANTAKLKGIKTNSYELGWQFAQGGLDGKIAAYYSLSDGSINFDRKTLLISSIGGEKKIYGIEGKLSYWLNNQFQVGSYAHIIRTKVKSAEGKWETPEITEASPSKLGAWFRWKGENSDLAVQLNTSLSLKGANDQKINGFTTVDVGYNYHWKNSTISLGVQNLFNRQYTTTWGERAKVYYGASVPKYMVDFKGRGRTITLAFKQSF